MILSGLPALSPVSRVRDPATVTRQVLEQTGCVDRDMPEQCLREKPVQDIISVKVRKENQDSLDIGTWNITYESRGTLTK